MLHQIAAEAVFMIRERVARVQNDRDLRENAAAICNCKEVSSHLFSAYPEMEFELCTDYHFSI